MQPYVTIVKNTVCYRVDVYNCTFTPWSINCTEKRAQLVFMEVLLFQVSELLGCVL